MGYDVCCVGHITLDKVTTPRATVFMPGGTAYYFSCAVARLPLRCLLVTSVADAEAHTLLALQEKGIAVHRLYTARTVFFENRYGHNPNERTQRVLACADPFLLQDLLLPAAKIFHLGPLLNADIPDEALPALAARAKVSLDVQGLLRTVEGETVLPVDWPAKKEALPFVHFLKASEEEAFILTGHRDVCESARQLSAWGAKEVIITLGSRGSVIYSGDRFYRIPAFRPTQVADATGCGDTYMAGYLYRRWQGAGIQEAGEFGAAMATAKLAVSGPFSGAEEDVLAVIKTQERYTN